MNFNVKNGWKAIIDRQTKMPYFKKLVADLSDLPNVIPAPNQVLRAFELTDYQDVKVVILGQDPYPNANHATGLAFGVPVGSSLPRTLVNIVNEVELCLNEDKPASPIMLDKTNMTLEGWAKQGVLLINSIMTTEEKVAGAHQGMGWEQFTDSIIFSLKQRAKPIVFLLWGMNAQKKADLLLEKGGSLNYIKILHSTHPSPLSYNRGPFQYRFLGCKHFLEANKFLKFHGLEPINWQKTGG